MLEILLQSQPAGASFAKQTFWRSYCKANLLQLLLQSIPAWSWSCGIGTDLICSFIIALVDCCCPSSINILEQSICGGSIDVVPCHIHVINKLY